MFCSSAAVAMWHMHTILCVYLQLIQTISKVMEPTAAKAVKGWLKGADHKGLSVHLSMYIAWTPQNIA